MKKGWLGFLRWHEKFKENGFHEDFFLRPAKNKLYTHQCNSRFFWGCMGCAPSLKLSGPENLQVLIKAQVAFANSLVSEIRAIKDFTSARAYFVASDLKTVYKALLDESWSFSDAMFDPSADTWGTARHVLEWLEKMWTQLSDLCTLRASYHCAVRAYDVDKTQLVSEAVNVGWLRLQAELERAQRKGTLNKLCQRVESKLPPK
mmetsp:Transcript_37008/g.94575  ORF Transcript_37008/g.94575 Transcript_37008/m.94575 type:complete len:204 (-) Transcript_37008:38-649(-)